LLRSHHLGEQAAQQPGERELASEFERLHERVARKLVGERGARAVVVRLLGEAATANLAARRFQRAARTARLGKTRQVVITRGAERVRSRAAAQKTDPAEESAA
jgi:hypothetical protein